MAQRATLIDGTEIVIRPLLVSDRAELVEGYERLSAKSRHLRFFLPPKHLSKSLLDYMTTIDFHHHFALAAYVDSGDLRIGLGVARWVRDRTDEGRAEAAVTVADDWQGRGVGTQLLLALVAEARLDRIKLFTADVLWENTALLERMRALGARIRGEEPGVARLEFDLPETPEELDSSALFRFFAAMATGE